MHITLASHGGLVQHTVNISDTHRVSADAASTSGYLPDGIVQNIEARGTSAHAAGSKSGPEAAGQLTDSQWHTRLPVVSQVATHTAAAVIDHQSTSGSREVTDSNKYEDHWLV